MWFVFTAPPQSIRSWGVPNSQQWVSSYKFFPNKSYVNSCLRHHHKHYGWVILSRAYCWPCVKAIVDLCNNISAVTFAMNNYNGSWSRHIKNKDQVSDEFVTFRHIRTKSMIADPLTKHLLVATFKCHIKSMWFIKKCLYKEYVIH